MRWKGFGGDLPSWCDEALLEEGCRFWCALWPYIMYQFHWAMIGGFGADAASMVLLRSRYWATKGASGRLDTFRRLQETFCFLYDISGWGAKGFLDFGPSWRACTYTRFLHTRARWKIRTNTEEEWDVERWGEPINQVEESLLFR